MTKLKSSIQPIAFTIAVIVILSNVAVFGQAETDSTWADSTHVAVDTTQTPAVQPEPADTQTIIWPTRFEERLLSLFAASGPARTAIDLPQATSWWKFNPQLARISITPWGDFESFYPLGLAPTQLSRYDAAAGEMAIANPIPLPQSEEFIHSEIADYEAMLSPSLAGVISPFGRPFSIYQRLTPPESDSARSRIFVTRGRGGFANTTFRFQNYFGPFGRVGADGTFQKTDGLYLGANTKMERMRFTAAPQVGKRVKLELLYAFNRLKGDRLIFPSDYGYSGFTSDYLSVYALNTELFSSPNSIYSGRLTYKNSDQKFDESHLLTAEKSKLVEFRLANRRSAGPHVMNFALDARYLRFRDQGVTTNAVYYNAGASDIVTLSSTTSAFAHAAIVGSNDLSPRPVLTAAVARDLGNSIAAVAIATHAAVVPGSEMQYGVAKSAAFETDSIDYRLQPDDEIGTGSATGVDFMLKSRSDRLEVQVRSGYYLMRDFPDWSADFDSLVHGEFTATGVDRDLWYAAIDSRVRLHPRLTASLAYGVRRVTDSGVDKTFGPAHTGSALALYKLPVRRLKIDLSFGVGAKFRSAANRHLIGAPEDGVLTIDSYFTFDLKGFHFFFNFENLLGTEYTIAGLDQLGRSVWWGFNWAFLD